MPRLSQIAIAKKRIEYFLDSKQQHTFTLKQLIYFFNINQKNWKLGDSYSANSFIKFLLEQSYLKKINIPTHNLYSWRTDNIQSIIYEIAVSLKPRSYISYYSAMFLNNLTEQIPKTIYVTYERLNALPSRKTTLTQKNIDTAFQKEERSSGMNYEVDNFIIQLISSARNDKIGVIPYTLESGSRIFVTNIERTLIDATVRPSLSGGILEIIKAYRNALPQLQINKMKAYISNMNYTYPYQQAIGFYLDYIGLPEKRLKRIETLCKNEYDFYLDRKLKNPLYSQKWRIYYPDYLK